MDTTKLYIEATFHTILNELAEMRAELEALKAAAAAPEALYEGEASVQWYDGLRLITLWTDTPLTGVTWDGPDGPEQRVTVKVYAIETERIQE